MLKRFFILMFIATFSISIIGCKDEEELKYKQEKPTVEELKEKYGYKPKPGDLHVDEVKSPF
ncbi:MAG: hypothetical protein LBV80_11550 [Deltaproteobacteria bacterium]|nr:hypothetical protein [Deltaproteobacteria bacterium]